MLRVLIKVAAFLLFLAQCLFGMSTLGAYLRYTSKDQYIDETFYVTGASVTGHHGNRPFLEGKIHGVREILVDPSAPSIPLPDYLQLFPAGTQVAVKFNPEMTRIQFQHQSLRVLKRDWHFEHDLETTHLYLAFVALPSLLTVATLYATRKKRSR